MIRSAECPYPRAENLPAAAVAVDTLGDGFEVRQGCEILDAGLRETGVSARDERALGMILDHAQDQVPEPGSGLSVKSFDVMPVQHFQYTGAQFLQFTGMYFTALHKNEPVGLRCVHAGHQLSPVFLYRQLAGRTVVQRIRRFVQIPDELLADMPVLPQGFLQQRELDLLHQRSVRAHQRTAAAGLLIPAGRHRTMRGGLQQLQALRLLPALMVLCNSYFRGFSGQYTGAEHRYPVIIADAFPVDSGFDKVQLHFRNTR